MKFDAINRMRNSNLKPRILFHFGNLVSRVLSERKIEMRKRGRKLITYLELKKCWIWNNFENRKSPPTGRKTEPKSSRAFFLQGDRNRKRMSNTRVTIVKGAKGTQSLNIPSRIFHKEPKSSTKNVLVIG